MKKWILLCTLFLGIIPLGWSQNNTQGYQVGDTARDFELKNVDGRYYTLDAIEVADGFVVVFTCNHCPYSKAYEDRLIALNDKYSLLGYPVIAINPNDPVKQPDDSFVKMKERSKEKGFTFIYLHDDTQEIAKAYGATRTPHVYLLDKNRVVRYIGAIDDNAEDASAVREKYLENAINDLRQGKPVAVPQTKAIGCTIKWKA